METTHNTKLSASEISNLWAQFQNDSLNLCINTYMYQNLEDQQIKLVFKNAISTSWDNLCEIKAILKKEKYPIPQGFTSHDVHVDAPKLYSDALCMKYLHKMTIHGMSTYSVSMTSSTRQDMREFYAKTMNNALSLYNQSIEVLLSKGIYHRPPNIPTPDGIDFVKTEYFLDGFWGNRRSLNGIEISNIYFNLKKSIISRAIILGFSQVAKSKEVRKLLIRAAQIKQKHITMFTKCLLEDDLPAPPTWDSDITDSTIPPFSDKLMMYLTGFLYSTANAYYGAGIATSMRSDLIINYERIIPENLKFGETWTDLMIKNQWLEQPPKATDRKALAKS